MRIRERERDASLKTQNETQKGKDDRKGCRQNRNSIRHAGSSSR